MTGNLIVKSLILFIAAGICEIGGGYLVWLWLRNGKGILLGALGGLILFLYGIIPTLQPAHFGRVYAAYGGVFVILSILWGCGWTSMLLTVLMSSAVLFVLSE